MSGGKKVCEAVIHTVNLSAYKTAQRTVPLSKCLVISPCKNTRLPPCPTKNIPVVPTCPPYEQLRLCNPINARKLCKPEPCLCLPKRPPMTKSEKFAYTLRFALKCGAVIGLVWYTNEQGVWSGHHEITCMYGRIMSQIRCWTGLNVGPKSGEYPEVPHLHNVSAKMTEFWNMGVVNFFNRLLIIPRKIILYIDVVDPESAETSQASQGKPQTVIVKKGACNM